MAQVNRDLPNLINQIREHADSTIAQSMASVDARHRQFAAALEDLSENTRMVEQRAEQLVQDASKSILEKVRQQDAQLRRDHTTAMHRQRDTLLRAIDAERAERNRRIDALASEVADIRQGAASAAQLTDSYMSDTRILREQVAALPHERFRPGALRELDDRLQSLHNELRDNDLAPYLLSNARDLCQEMGALRREVAILDDEWRALRCAAEQDLLRIRGVIDHNTTLDTSATFGVDLPGPRPDVDLWSRGALSRLQSEVDSLLAQVGDTDAAPTSEELREWIAARVPALDQRLDAIVGQAVTALRSSQLRANLAGLIADALDDVHHYQVVEGCVGYEADDERNAFLAKTANPMSGGEIVIEIGPDGDDEAAPPIVHMHSYDKLVNEEERTSRTADINATIYDRTGIRLGAAVEEAAEPDRDRHDVARLIGPTEHSETRRQTEQRRADPR